jgi:sec-independent protein translocase protein TatB
MGIPPPIETANISMGDTLLLMVIALVVLGPRRLPQVGRQIGKLMYEFRKASNDFKFQMEEELRQSEEADRRKKEEEERNRALAAAPAPAQIAPPAESSITPADPQAMPPPPEPPAEIAADVAETNVTATTESGAPAAGPAAAAEPTSEGGVEATALEPAAPRILPPTTGETVPAERPGAHPRQRELFTADDGKAPERAAPEAERSEPATQHAEQHG